MFKGKTEDMDEKDRGAQALKEGRGEERMRGQLEEGKGK